MGALGAMQDFPLRIMRLMDHAEREHGNREIVAARPDGTMIRTNWIEVADKARRLGQALERLGVDPGERVATLAMNHDRHLVAWFGVVGMGGVLHTLNPRLFDDQLRHQEQESEAADGDDRSEGPSLTRGASPPASVEDCHHRA